MSILSFFIDIVKGSRYFLLETFSPKAFDQNRRRLQNEAAGRVLAFRLPNRSATVRLKARRGIFRFRSQVRQCFLRSCGQYYSLPAQHD